jgi:hypothetical protein
MILELSLPESSNEPSVIELNPIIEVEAPFIGSSKKDSERFEPAILNPETIDPAHFICEDHFNLETMQQMPAH